MAEPTRHYRIRELAKMLNVEPSALRHWEAVVDVTPLRSKSGQRVYAPQHVAKFQRVAELRGKGLSLEAIKQALAGGCCPLCGRTD